MKKRKKVSWYSHSAVGLQIKRNYSRRRNAILWSAETTVTDYGATRNRAIAFKSLFGYSRSSLTTKFLPFSEILMFYGSR